MNPASSSQAGSQLNPVSGGSLPPRNLSKYNLQQLAELASAAGLPQPALMASIAMAESGGKPDRISPPDSDGSHDVGLWQINSKHGYSDTQMQDPYYNVSAARVIFDSQGLGAWSTYNSGAYKQFLSTATFEAQQVGALNTAGGFSPITNTIHAAGSAVNAVGNAANSVTNVFGGIVSNLTSGQFWIMVLKILAGVVLIGVGLYMMVKGSNG